MAKRKTKIEIPDFDFIDDCIWMSYRYCIGRHTIAAAMHAPQMAKFLDMNPNVISEGRKKFMAKDIRQEISDVLNYRDDVSVDGFVEDVDAATLLLQHVVENHLDISQNWKFEIDLGMKTVYSYPSEGTSSTDLFQFFISDLLPWVKLANWLDPQEQITYRYKGETKTEPGFTFYSVLKDITAHKITCSKYAENPYATTYIDPKYILNEQNSCIRRHTW